ncbi:MAG: ribosomal protein S18-alanine N-acetyltransferase [Formosimonas sp.]
MTYRRLQPADLPAVAELEATVQRDPWSREQILAVADLLNANYMAWVAEDDGAIVGYLIAQHVVDAFEILTIGVAQTQQKRGIGRGLWACAWDEMQRQQPHTTCFLEVRSSNLAAQALYARCGFTAVGRRKNYYANPREDALILQKSHEHTS